MYGSRLLGYTGGKIGRIGLDWIGLDGERDGLDWMEKEIAGACEFACDVLFGPINAWIGRYIIHVMYGSSRAFVVGRFSCRVWMWLVVMVVMMV